MLKPATPPVIVLEVPPELGHSAAAVTKKLLATTGREEDAAIAVPQAPLVHVPDTAVGGVRIFLTS